VRLCGSVLVRHQQSHVGAIPRGCKGRSFNCLTFLEHTMAAPPSPSQVEPPPAPDPQRTAEARAAFTAHLTSIGNSHISPLEARVSDISKNSIAISKQEDDVAKQMKKLADESKKHQKVVDDAAGKLKELGDIQNWAEVLERDMLVIEKALQMGEGEDSGWETDEGTSNGEQEGQHLAKGDDKGKGKAEVKEEASRRQ